MFLAEWPPQIGEILAIRCETGVFLEAVKELEGGDRLSCSFMKPYMATRLDDYWCWPSHEDFYSIHKDCVLPVKPSVDVSVKMSTKRNVVYVCQNADIIRLFTK